MRLKSRVVRIERKINSPGNIPKEDLFQVITDDGTFDVKAKVKEIEKRFEEKYGTSEEPLIVILKKFTEEEIYGCLESEK